MPNCVAPSIDWIAAEAHLLAVVRYYIHCGSQGVMHLSNNVRPFRLRFDAGERTEALYNSIMELK